MADQQDIPANERSTVESEPTQIPHASSSYQRRQPRPRQTDMLSGIFWAAMLIMVGVIFLADNLDLLPQVGSGDPWDWIMLGAGGLLLFFAFIQALSPDHSGPGTFWTIAGAVLLAVGASSIFSINLSDWWPVILIILGLGSLTRAMRK